MDNLARKLEEGEVRQQAGTVVSVADDEWLVRTGQGEYWARRAVSCLVAPEPADRVVLASEPAGPCWVIAVLQRPTTAPARLVAERDMQVQLPAGRFTVAAQQGVSLVSGRDVALVASELDVNAVAGRMSVQRLSYFGRALLAEVDRVKLVASALDSVLERLSQRVKRSFRRVEQFDQLRAERIDYRADRSMNLHAEHTALTAEGLVKVDAEQIHLG